MQAVELVEKSNKSHQEAVQVRHMGDSANDSKSDPHTELVEEQKEESLLEHLTGPQSASCDRYPEERPAHARQPRR